MRPSAATTEISLTGVVANVAWRIASTWPARQESTPRLASPSSVATDLCNTRLGQRKAAPGREVQLLLALALNQAVQPNVERRHRRARKPHASNNGR